MAKVTINGTMFDDPWDDTAKIDLSKRIPSRVENRGSIDLAGLFNVDGKLGRTLRRTSGKIKLPRSSKVCPSCGDLQSDVQRLPLSCVEMAASFCPICAIIWLGLQQSRSRWKRDSTSTEYLFVDIYP